MTVKTTTAFRGGFAAGFSSPYASVFGTRSRMFPRRQDLVAQAWEQVGESMRIAIKHEKEDHDKAHLTISKAG